MKTLKGITGSGSGGKSTFKGKGKKGNGYGKSKWPYKNKGGGKHNAYFGLAEDQPEENGEEPSGNPQ